MLTVSGTDENLIEVKVTDTLKAADIRELSEDVNRLIAQQGSIRVLIDASSFDGWENIQAAEEHFSFVKAHHAKVERLAVVSGHLWQHWLGAMAKVFVHPDVKVFDAGQLDEAREWVKG